MEEMSQQNRPADDAALAHRWKRIGKTVAYVIVLLGACFWLAVFVVALRTGYLSRIGVAVGGIFAVSLIIGPVIQLTGRKRLGGVIGSVGPVLIILAVVVGLAASFWPQGNCTWRPYRLDDELAAIEARRAVPDAENAAHRYESVFAMIDTNDKPDSLFTGSSLRYEFEGQPWKGVDHPQASEWLDSRSDAIAMLLEIGKMEQCRWPVQAHSYDEYTVPYDKLRHCMLLLTAAGNRDLGEGRVRAALAKYFCVLRIADHIRQQPSKVDSMTGFGNERSGLHMIRRVLVENELSHEDITQIANHLPPTADPWPQEWERLLEFEKLQYMNLLGGLYEVNDDGAVRFAANPVISPKDEQKRGSAGGFLRVHRLMSMPRDPHAIRGIVDRYFAEFQHRIASECPPRRNRDEQDIRISWNDIAKGVCNTYRLMAEMFFFDEGGYVKHRQQRAPAITSRRGTWLVLGLRRYRDAHGTWPATLDEIGRYVPTEAFLDPTSGEAFLYVLDGDGFRLYSKGMDRADDGGRRGYVRALNKGADDIPLWPPAPKPEPPSKEELKQHLEEIYGREYVETHFAGDANDKR